MSIWQWRQVSGTVHQPVWAWEPPLSLDDSAGYPYPSLDKHESDTLQTDVLCCGDRCLAPAFGGLAWTDGLRLGRFDGPLLVEDQGPEPVVWRLDPATGLTVAQRAASSPDRNIHNPTDRPVAVPGWLAGPGLTLAPGQSWPAPLESPWRDPLLAAERVLAGEWREALPTSYALAATDRLLRAGRVEEAQALLAHPLCDAPGVPPGLAPFVRAFVDGGEPPWRWEIEWGAGFARGRLARLALEYAVECHDDVLAHYHLGCVLADWGRWDQAGVHWAAATDGQDAAEANRNLGWTARHVYHDEPAARAFYREALAIGAGPITRREASDLGLTD